MGMRKKHAEAMDATMKKASPATKAKGPRQKKVKGGY